jgi:hypothetical protein
VSESAVVVQPDEELYQASLAELRSPRPPAISSMLFTILMLVFVAGAFMNLRSISGVVTLVAVIALHEAGHALGMRMFGFSNVRMFFIPFFGAAVTGSARSAATWKEAIVTLMGPLPGIVLGSILVLVASLRAIPSRWHSM